MQKYKEYGKPKPLVIGHEPLTVNWPVVWTLPDIKYIKTHFSIEHELDCADLFTKFWNTNLAQYWDYQWQPDEIEDYHVESHGVYYDRKMVFNDNWFLIEVDRGTRPLGAMVNDITDEDKRIHFRKDQADGSSKTIVGQMAGYMHFANANKGKFEFAVLYTVQDCSSRIYDEAGTGRRLDYLSKMAAKNERADLFYFAHHRKLLADPLGAHFKSAADGQMYSILDI